MIFNEKAKWCIARHLGRMEPAQQVYETMFKYLNNLFND